MSRFACQYFAVYSCRIFTSLEGLGVGQSRPATHNAEESHRFSTQYRKKKKKEIRTDSGFATHSNTKQLLTHSLQQLPTTVCLQPALWESRCFSRSYFNVTAQDTHLLVPIQQTTSWCT